MRAEIVSIGTELLLGTITDTNASYLAQRLASLGIDCFFVSQVGDNRGRIVDVLHRAWGRSDLTLTTGGLGPTQDDLTREAVAEMLGETPRVDDALRTELQAFFRQRGMRMPERNVKQATLIPSARAIPNPIGTAPGWWVSRSEDGDTRTILCMPGVPFEMKRMWEQELEPKLQALSGTVIVSRTLKVLGLGEARVDELVDDLMSGANPTLAPYAKRDGVHLRISAKAASREVALGMIAELEAKVRERLGDAIYGSDEETPGSVVHDLLKRTGLDLAVVEIGRSAFGSVSGALNGTELKLSLRCSDLDQLNRLLGIAGGLEDASRAVQRASGAGAVLLIKVDEEAYAGDAGAVHASAEMLLCLGGAGRVETVNSAWRTAPDEVPRWVGLAAINLLRKRLLELSGK